MTFEKAQKKSGDAGKNFLRLLETRLDNTVYRLGLATSRYESRQIVSHGHITVTIRKWTSLLTSLKLVMLSESANKALLTDSSRRF